MPFDLPLLDFGAGLYTLIVINEGTRHILRREPTNPDLQKLEFQAKAGVFFLSQPLPLLSDK